MLRDKIERLWRRTIVATGVFALAVFIFMVVTHHTTGVHDTTFGMVLLLVFMLNAAAFTFLGTLYVLYAAVMVLLER